MIASLRTCLLVMMVSSLFVTGCAQSGKVSDDMKDHIEKELGAVEKVTVMSTDGQEVLLDLRLFLQELSGQGQDLQVSSESLKQEDVRFTLVLYRTQQAPLVVTVGESASEFGGHTYRGAGASYFYQWVNKLTGKGVLSQKIQSVRLSAEDLGQARVLNEVEAEYIRKVMGSAVPEVDTRSKQYPLYPNYQMRMNSADRPVEVAILTPTLIAVPFGRETFFFHVEGSLFSRLTEWMPPSNRKDDKIDPLFKSTRIRVTANGEMNVQDTKLDVTQTTIEQGIAHQSVRLLKNADPLNVPPKNPGPKQYELHFLVNDIDQRMEVYPRYFKYDQTWYIQDELAENVWKLFQSLRK
ncbi:hypothetical protein [Brevibacillus brevis]|uniref:hypothetical protein n=1 Tax=Brevibacillus brevis TaxID=1393 RepID=UPI001C8D15D5|nr:hypothetical protein [Brevibacillus brevis]MBY0088803.1 hypothetical protein [Brevibacillus brevis]